MTRLSWEVTFAARMATQLNFFRELKQSAADTQQRLAAATVAVFGLGGAGAATVLALGAAGVGTPLHRCPADREDRCVPVSVLHPGGGGAGPRSAWPAECRRALPRFGLSASTSLSSRKTMSAQPSPWAGFVVCCLDQAQSNLAYKLNCVCLADGLRWISCSLDGTEVTVGPAIHPGQRPACYLCYQMRLVACAGNPEDSFAFQKIWIDARATTVADEKTSCSGPGLAANLLGVEVLKELTGLAEPSLVGRILTVGLTDLSIEKHAVLRKPWCPACFPKAESDHGG